LLVSRDKTLREKGQRRRAGNEKKAENSKVCELILLHLYRSKIYGKINKIEKYILKCDFHNKYIKSKILVVSIVVFIRVLPLFLLLFVNLLRILVLLLCLLISFSFAPIANVYQIIPILKRP